MGTVYVCIFVLMFGLHDAASSIVWMKMSEAAVNTDVVGTIGIVFSVSRDVFERHPAQVLDLSPLVVNTSQLQIYSVDLHSPYGLTSSVEVSKVTDRKFNATYGANSLVVDVRGQASFGILKFTIDSRVILRNSILSLRYILDSGILRVMSCEFAFIIEQIYLRDQSLQRFVGMWKSQFERMPERAICYKIFQRNRDQPYFLFGLSEMANRMSMVPRAARLQDSNLYIALQRTDDTGSVSTIEVPPDLRSDGTATLTVFFPTDFFSELTDHVIKDVLRKFVDVSSSRVTTRKLNDYFEMAQSVLDGVSGYLGSFKINLENRSARITEDGVYMTVPFTLHYNASSTCGTYDIFTLEWKLEISAKVAYNDHNFYLRIGDIRSEVTLTDLKLGNPKNLQRLIEDLTINKYFQNAIVEDLGFFLDNTGVLRNTAFTGVENYVVLRSNTSGLYTISSWKHFGTTFSGDHVTTKTNTKFGDTVKLSDCGNDIGSRSDSRTVTSTIMVFVMSVGALMNCI